MVISASAGPQWRTATIPVLVRTLLGLMWLYNVAWKRPPDFGRSSDSGLHHYAAYAVSDPVLPPFSWMVEHLVLPNIEIFGWGVLVVETGLAVMFLTGTWVRFAAVLGAVQSLLIGLCVAFAPDEWPWAYWLMIGAHVLLLSTQADRFLSVDGVRSHRSSGRALAGVWGGLAALVGAVAVLFAGTETARLGSTELSVSAGTYALLPAGVLLLTGLLLIGAARCRSALLAIAAGSVGITGAVGVHVCTLTGPAWASGNGTSAAVLTAVAVVGFGVAGSLAAPATAAGRAGQSDR